MVITFKELRFKNILSFGNQETVIEFSKGLNLVSGPNGSAKSGGLLDTLSFCLFGKPYRNIKIKELINRKNKKNLETYCKFTIDNKDSVEIRRTLNPDSLEIVKNGTEADLLSSKKLNQEELNKIIGIDYHLFKQVICLAVNYNKPFLSLSSNEKREIIEQIFNITVFGQMLKEAKKVTVDNEVKCEMNNHSINILAENLKSQRNSIAGIKEDNKEFEKNKEMEIAAIDTRIDKYKNEIQLLSERINKIENLLNSTLIINIEQIHKFVKTV
jgi:DNA repair exonuclease SbcCD ATPase subunit